MQITSEHPVYVEGKGWTPAENPVTGDRLRHSDGGRAKAPAVAQSLRRHVAGTGGGVGGGGEWLTARVAIRLTWVWSGR